MVGIAAKRLRKTVAEYKLLWETLLVASETINGYQEVKSFGGEDYEINRFNKASDNNRRQNLKLEATNSVASPLVQIFVSAALPYNLVGIGCFCSIADDSGTFIVLVPQGC